MLNKISLLQPFPNEKIMPLVDQKSNPVEVPLEVMDAPKLGLPVTIITHKQPPNTNVDTRPSLAIA
jgi:hypothetical protein